MLLLIRHCSASARVSALATVPAIAERVDTCVLLLIQYLQRVGALSRHERRSRHAHASNCCALIDWQAVQEGIKDGNYSMSSSLVGVARTDSMTDWEPDK